MDRDRSRRTYGLKMHQDQVWDTIKEYRYFAPAKLALDEGRNRFPAESALSRVRPVTGGAIERRLLMEGVRYRLGQCLLRIGTLLCGAPNRSRPRAEPDRRFLAVQTLGGALATAHPSDTYRCAHLVGQMTWV